MYVVSQAVEMHEGTVYTYVSSSTTLNTTNLNKYNSLSFSGKLNGTHIKAIREWATSANRGILDLAGATIVSGGDAYYTETGGNKSSYYTEDNVIGISMFVDCNFEKIILPQNITSIEKWAFNTCMRMTDLVIPESVTSLANAFFGCNHMISITIPKSITSIVAFTFSECN